LASNGSGGAETACMMSNRDQVRYLTRVHARAQAHAQLGQFHSTAVARAIEQNSLDAFCTSLLNPMLFPPTAAALYTRLVHGNRRVMRCAALSRGLLHHCPKAQTSCPITARVRRIYRTFAEQI
jgi:hypothetical protein